MEQSYSTSNNGQHKGRSTTPRNQQHENLNGWDNKHPSCSYFGYQYNHQMLLK
ncbi:hypothetical protein CDL12_09936 [Handroanthus impetiginosus]|uniref:Uncharacterized protein n=1 Tax=Handroanthus impetiginosus TaxID=429701 RepID=A0A2G9G9Y0_9LAMI|nr:hypothetical protein CDL12_25385 [Handroanthus impetiginosus]PIN17396.1 hypothetical protein CDL12_09936 [Handroanthus impetiginosus]